VTLIAVEVADRQAAALERIATALEQMALARMDDPRAVAVHGPSHPEMPTGFPTGEPPLPTPPPNLPVTPIMAPLPPVVAAPFTFTPSPGCPVHHVAWKIVPAGVSKKTGRAYAAFAVCPESGCEQRPPQ